MTVASEPDWADVPGLQCTIAGCGNHLRMPVPAGSTAEETIAFLASDPACQRAVRERAPGWVCGDCIRGLTDVLIGLLRRAREAS